MSETSEPIPGGIMPERFNSTSAFTPGPWSIFHNQEDDEPRWAAEVNAQEGSEFDYGICNHERQEWIADAIKEADAHLIAAAPDLLRVLEEQGHKRSNSRRGRCSACSRSGYYDHCASCGQHFPCPAYQAIQDARS